VNFTPEFNHEEIGLSDELLKSIINDLDLNSSSGGTRSLNSLKSQLSVSLVPPGSSDNDTEQPVLNLAVTGSDREAIKEIADRWVELYLQRASEILASEVKRYYELISAEYYQMREELQAKIEERIEARKSHNLQLLKTEVDVLRDKYKDYLSAIEQKESDLERKRAQLRTLKSFLEDEPRYLSIERSIPPENLFTENQPSEEEPSNQQENDNGIEERAIKIRDQEVNEIFLTLKEKEIDTDVEVTSLEEEVDYILAKLDEFRSKINDTQATIDRVQLDMEELDREINRLRKTSDTLYTALKKARTATKENGTIKLLSDPSSVKTLDSVNTKQNVAVAGVLGLFIGVLVAFFKNYMEDYEEESDEEVENEESKDKS
ncbi:hypothetical protein KGY79_06180, partial [Candidatus Bipolaricaulota bacterium]|nr:hypothetical protein [Candidatus Bipolaricaulota bacterium]